MMDTGSFQTEDLLANFDVDLHKFYLEALAKELDVRKRQNVRAIKIALKEVVEAYKKKSGNDGHLAGKSLRFDSAAKRCGYVLKHSTCFTSAVARHVLGLATEFPRVFGNAIQSGHSQATLVFSVCCLGGGPASDVVGFCKVLSFFCRQHSRERLKLNVTVVDINEDWVVTADNVLNTLAGAVWMKGVELSFDFFQADLTKPFEENVKMVLGSADVVTMVYFLSAVNRGKNTIESFQMIKEIMKCMRNDSVLFFLDSATEVHYKQMSSAAASIINMTQVYGPQIEEFHTLSMDSVRKFLNLHKRCFGKFLCLTNCFVSSSAWCKMTASSFEYKYETCNTAIENLIVLDSNEEYANKSLVLFLNRYKNSVPNQNSKVDKSITLNSSPAKFSSKDNARSTDNNIRDASWSKNNSLTLNDIKHKFWSMEKSVTINNLQDRFWLMDKPSVTKNDFHENSSVITKEIRYLPDKTCKSLLNCNKGNDFKPLLVDRKLKDKCSFINQNETLTLKNSQRQAVSRLTAKMLRFRAQIDRLLAEEFEQFHIKEEIIDEIDSPSEDEFDNLPNEYINFVPKYFFQTKSKKRRIFAEWI